RVAVKTADQRLIQIEHGKDNALRQAHVFIEQVRIGGICSDVLEVPTRREGPAGSREHHDVRVLIERCEIEDIRQLLVHVAVDGIESLGSIQGDGQQAPASFQQE